MEEGEDFRLVQPAYTDVLVGQPCTATCCKSMDDLVPRTEVLHNLCPQTGCVTSDPQPNWRLFLVEGTPRSPLHEYPYIRR